MGANNNITLSDKALHFTCCFCIAVFSLIQFDWWGLIIPMSIAVSKEVYDELFKDGLDWYDVLADVVGIAFGIGMYLIL